MYLWNADVTKAFTEADHPKKIYYMRSIKISKIGGRHDTLIFHFPPMRLILSSRTPRAILKAL
jgi:hypothetical protein